MYLIFATEKGCSNTFIYERDIYRLCMVANFFYDSLRFCRIIKNIPILDAIIDTTVYSPDMVFIWEAIFSF